MTTPTSGPTAGPSVAVIGGGVLGTAVARSLAVRGARVTLYERTRLGAGTTGTTFAWINSHSKNPRSYHDLNIAGMAEHHALQRAADGSAPRWFFPTGNLEWAEDDAGRERLDEALGELSSRGYPLRRITQDEARTHAPDLRIPSAVRDIALFPEEGYVLPAALLARLWGEAREHGAELCCPAEVSGLEPAGGGVRLTLSDGTSAHFDHVVTATGRWTAHTTALAGTPVPMADPDEAGSATVGFLAYTGPVPTRLAPVLTTPRLNVRPEGGGRLVIQGLDLDPQADPGASYDPGGPLAKDLLGRLADLLHGTEGAWLESLRVGQRALPADGLTVAGRLRPGLPVYTVATHSGITLGPLLGRLVAEDVLTGDRDLLLEGFAPSRLTSTRAEDHAPLERARFAGQQ
ncbi:FAD-dependent oxidoreductase [Streptomyces sp. ODS28]|uniref:NAD(P)/FAD-dependent oxidoreductase n=1 Tax=Streptomyces sp. ODS28 TaxID=3136688 RepID=UPI0031EAFA32